MPNYAGECARAAVAEPMCPLSQPSTGECARAAVAELMCPLSQPDTAECARAAVAEQMCRLAVFVQSTRRYKDIKIYFIK